MEDDYKSKPFSIILPKTSTYGESYGRAFQLNMMSYWKNTMSNDI